MSSGPSVETLDSQVRALEEAVQRQKKAAKNRTMVTGAMVALFAFAIVWRMFSDYSYMRSEWTEQRIQTSLQKELEQLMPAASRELDQLCSALLPVFAEQGQSQLSQRWPAIQQKLFAEGSDLCQKMVEYTHRSLEDSSHEVGQRIENVVLSSYPSFKDPQQRSELHRIIQTKCERAMENALQDFQSRFQGRLLDTQSSVAAFDSNRLEDSVDLQKRFVQLWLHLLEEEIMSL